MATKQFASDDVFGEVSSESNGKSTYRAVIEFVDLNGDYMRRRVTIGNRYGSLTAAQKDAQALRNANDGLMIEGKFTVNL